MNHLNLAQVFKRVDVRHPNPIGGAMSIAAIMAVVPRGLLLMLAIVCCLIPAQPGRSSQSRFAVTSHCGAQVLDFRTADIKLGSWSSQFVVSVGPTA